MHLKDYDAEDASETGTESDEDWETTEEDSDEEGWETTTDSENKDTKSEEVTTRRVNFILGAYLKKVPVTKAHKISEPALDANAQSLPEAERRDAKRYGDVVSTAVRIEHVFDCARVIKKNELVGGPVGAEKGASWVLNSSAKVFTPVASRQLGGSGGGFVKALDPKARSFMPENERERRRRFYQSRSVGEYMEHGESRARTREMKMGQVVAPRSETRGERVQHVKVASARKCNGAKKSQERKQLGADLTVRSEWQGTKVRRAQAPRHRDNGDGAE